MLHLVLKSSIEGYRISRERRLVIIPSITFTNSSPVGDTGKESTVAGVEQREDELVDDPELEMLLDCEHA